MGPPRGAITAGTPFELLFNFIIQVHNPTTPYDPATGHDLARLATDDKVLQGLQEQLEAAVTVTSKELVDAACDPKLMPEEVREFWTAFLDETRYFDQGDWWKNWRYGLKTWRALYGAFLTPVGFKYAVLLSVLSKHLVHVAYQQNSDVERRKAMSEFYQPIRDAMTQALKDTTTKMASRRDALFGLAITLFRIFFHLQTHQLSAQITQLIRPHMPKLSGTYEYEGRRRRIYSVADEVEFRFLLGVYYLGQRRIVEAHKEFEKSFNLCSHKVSFRNRRLILVRLATTSLLLGIIPARSLLQSFGLWDAFRPLIYGIRHGDLDTFREALGLGTVEYAQERAEYFRTYKILGILQEKGEVLVWRSLLRKTLLLYRKMNNLAPTDRPSLPISWFLTALRFTTSDESYDMQDAECICISLLDQGFVRAYIVHSSQLLVFSKEADMGFPSIARVRMK